MQNSEVQKSWKMYDLDNVLTSPDIYWLNRIKHRIYKHPNDFTHKTSKIGVVYSLNSLSICNPFLHMRSHMRSHVCTSTDTLPLYVHRFTYVWAYTHQQMCVESLHIHTTCIQGLNSHSAYMHVIRHFRSGTYHPVRNKRQSIYILCTQYIV